MRILTVCGMGFGTSLMLLMSIQEIAEKKYGFKVQGEACDLGSAKGRQCDLIVAATDIAKELKDWPVDVVSIENIVDKIEIERKVIPVLQAKLKSKEE